MRTAVQQQSSSARKRAELFTGSGTGSRTLLAEAAAWEQGARAEFDALVEFVRTNATASGAEGACMARLAVVGAALIKCLGSRRQAGSRRRRSGRSA